MEAENQKSEVNANLKELTNALGALAVLESKLSQQPIDSEFIQKVKLWSVGLFRIVVMGEIKKGKSSFINALLGVKDLVPVSSNIATSTIYKIGYGEKVAYKVFFTKESGKACLEIGKDELAKYGTEDGNPGNEKQVDFIQVSVKSDILKGGLVIIDTPGLGGLFKQHKRITYEYVPKADAVFLVSDSVESPIGKAELDLLEDLKKVTDQIFFVQTKAMAVDGDARAARECNNRRTLANHGFDEKSLHYFVVDSHLKHEADEARDLEDLEDSGFKTLVKCVNEEIKANVHRNIVRSAVKVAAPKLAAVETAIAGAEKILSADNESARKEIAEQLSAAEKDAENWQRNELPRIQDRLQDGLRDIKDGAVEGARRCRPGGKFHEIVNRTISACADVNTLLQKLMEFSNNASDRFTEERHSILSDAQIKVESLLRQFDDCKLSVKSEIVPVAYSDNSVEVNTSSVARAIESNDPQKVSGFDTARTAMYGGMAGAGMASIVGGLIGSVIPGIGTIIGSTIGLSLAGVFGAVEATKIKDSNELEKAKQQALGAVAQSFASGYQNLVEGIQKALADIERSVMRALRDAVSRRQEDIQRGRKELQRRQSETAAQLNERRQQVMASRREFTAIRTVVDRAV